MILNVIFDSMTMFGSGFVLGMLFYHMFLNNNNNDDDDHRRKH